MTLNAYFDGEKNWGILSRAWVGSSMGCSVTDCTCFYSLFLLFVSLAGGGGGVCLILMSFKHSFVVCLITE